LNSILGWRKYFILYIYIIIIIIIIIIIKQKIVNNQTVFWRPNDI
jgi:hypothetical protein